MGTIRTAAPRVALVVAAFSQFEEILDQVPASLEVKLGPVALTSPRFPFTETAYYTKSMGQSLLKQFFVFQQLQPFDQLAPTKVWTNNFEETFRGRPEYPVDRPLNLDPGTLDAAKFVLASTKDHMHRLYLADGIFGEITLYYQHHQWREWPWTYPDYRRADVQAFLTQARDFYRRETKAAN